MNLCEWLYDELYSNVEKGNPLSKYIIAVLNFISIYWWRIFIRGKCAILGCDEHYSHSNYLPDDCTEWWCGRCSAEGINHMSNTVSFFYKDTPIRNFIESLKGN